MNRAGYAGRDVSAVSGPYVVEYFDANLDAWRYIGCMTRRAMIEAQDRVFDRLTEAGDPAPIVSAGRREVYS